MPRRPIFCRALRSACTKGGRPRRLRFPALFGSTKPFVPLPPLAGQHLACSAPLLSFSIRPERFAFTQPSCRNAAGPRSLLLVHFFSLYFLFISSLPLHPHHLKLLFSFMPSSSHFSQPCLSRTEHNLSTTQPPHCAKQGAPTPPDPLCAHQVSKERRQLQLLTPCPHLFSGRFPPPLRSPSHTTAQMMAVQLDAQSLLRLCHPRHLCLR